MDKLTKIKSLFRECIKYFCENRKKKFGIMCLTLLILLEIVLVHESQKKWLQNFCSLSPTLTEVYASCSRLNLRLYGSPIIVAILTFIFYFIPEILKYIKINFIYFYKLACVSTEKITNLPQKVQNFICYFIVSGFMCYIFWAKFGFEIVNPANTAWLTVDDAGQHYLGWVFYRSEPWSFPWGREPHLNYPFGSTVGFTDSNPLLAIPLKLFRNFLPEQFQYIGLWSFACYILQAIFSAALVREWKCHFYLKILAASFIAFSPILLVRFDAAFYHDTLLCHWLILWFLVLYFSSSPRFWTQFIYMNIIILLSAWVHPYVAIMMIILSFSLIYKNIISLKKSSFYYFLLLFVPILLAYVSFFVIGFFGGSYDLFFNEFGVYSFNLNSFFNSYGKSSFLNPLPIISHEQMEGFSYIGIGFIFLFIIFLFMSEIKSRLHVFNAKKAPLFFSLVVLALLAITNKISFNAWEVNIPLDSFLLKKLGTVRASGRFIWPFYYVFIIFILYRIAHSTISSRKKLGLFALGFVLQYLDLAPLYSRIHFDYGTFPLKIDKQKWLTYLKDKNKIIFYPPYAEKNYGGLISFHDFWWLASQCHCYINRGYFSRPIPFNLQQSEKVKISEQWKRGSLYNDALYVMTPLVFDAEFSQYAQKFSVHCLIIDGLKVCSVAK